MIQKTLRGVVHGNMIELEGDAGLADGEHVEVVLRRIESHGAPGEGFLRTEGSLENDDEWDTIMEEIQQARKQERRSQWDQA